MVSNLDLVYMIFTLSLFNNYIVTSAKCLDGTAINVYRNHNGSCIGNALTNGCSAGPLRKHRMPPGNFANHRSITEADLTAWKECYVARGCVSRMYI